MRKQTIKGKEQTVKEKTMKTKHILLTITILQGINTAFSIVYDTEIWTQLFAMFVFGCLLGRTYSLYID